MEPSTSTKVYISTNNGEKKNIYSQNNSYFLVVFTSTCDLEMHEGWAGWVKIRLAAGMLSAD